MTIFMKRKNKKNKIEKYLSKPSSSLSFFFTPPFFGNSPVNNNISLQPYINDSILRNSQNN